MKKCYLSIITLILHIYVLLYSCSPNMENDLIKKINDSNKKKEQTNTENSWDWTKPESYDFSYSMIAGKKNISSPFHTQASADSKITEIIMARDYLPEQGWVLLAKVFGKPDNYMQSKNPYFILYNKYLGTIRLYMFNGEPTNYGKAALTVSWLYGSTKNAMFSPSEIYRYSNEEYHSGSKNSGTIVNFIKEYYSGAWFVTEFPVSYDPHINYAENLVLRFRMQNEVKGDVDLKSEFDFKTKTRTESATTNSSETDPYSDVYNFLNKGNKVLSVVKTENINNYYEKVNNALDKKNFKGHEKLGNIAENLKKLLNGKDLKNPLYAIGAVSTAIGGPLGAWLAIKFFRKI